MSFHFYALTLQISFLKGGGGYGSGGYGSYGGGGYGGYGGGYRAAELTASANPNHIENSIKVPEHQLAPQVRKFISTNTHKP